MTLPVATTEIHQLSVTDLSAQIAAGELGAREAVDAFIQRAESLDGQVNAIVQPRFEAARREADLADAAVRAGEPLGALHGVPITIKDCFDVEGADTTLGIPDHSSGAATADSPLVARLRAAGAIVLGKTNVPQGMLLHECSNPLFGRTLHPLSDERSPGGSSGGEAAAVAARMTPLGLASDLGGSIRQPSHCCGLVGFKPTSQRLSIVGSSRAMPGMRALVIQPGPITHSVADADLAMRVLLDDGDIPRQCDERPEPWPDYWRVDLSGLRVAYWTDNRVARPATAVARAVESSAADLRDQGADVREVECPEVEEMLKTYLGLISADGLCSLGRLLKGKPKDPQLRRQVALGRMPRWLRGPLSGVLRMVGQKSLGRLLSLSGPRSSDDYWQKTVEADRYRQRFWQSVDAAFDGQPVDVILTPPHSLPALRHGSALHLLLEASHCYLANLLDAPAGVVPRGVVSEDEEQQELANSPGGWAVEAGLRRKNAEASAGLPVGVQVMARPWRDDVALAVMEALE